MLWYGPCQWFAEQMPISNSCVGVCNLRKRRIYMYHIYYQKQGFRQNLAKLELGLVSMKQWTQLLTFFLSTCLLAKPLFSLIKSTSVLDKSTFCCSHSDVRRLNLNLRWFATTFCCEKLFRWWKPHFVGRIHMFVCSIWAFVCWTVSWTHVLLGWTHNFLATTSILLVKSKFLLVKSVLLLEKSKFS